MASDHKVPTPYQLGERYFKDGRKRTACPFVNRESREAFHRGWYNAQSAYLARTQPH